MNKRIIYILGGNYAANGMSQVIVSKMNWLAINTDYRLYAVMTEGLGKPMFYPLNEQIQVVNFDINFDELDTMPLHKKMFHFIFKQLEYKKKLSKYLQDIKADIVVSAMRREINFINDINDGSKKIGEIHFNKSNYRIFSKPYLPQWFNEYITKQWRRKLIEEIKRLEKFIVLSNEDKKEWTELQNVEVIHNFINKFPDRLSECTNKRVIAAGRYTWQKGFDNLIKSWEIINEKHPDWQLHIYGSGNNEEYQNLAIDYGLKEKVFCHSTSKELYDKMLDSSIFILSSRYEGFGLVITEAMSCGLPVVSFACPCGPKDIITDGKNGYLVEPENVEALAERICHLIEHEELRKEMGKAARKRAEDFQEDKIMQKWVDLFENIK